MVQRWGTGQAQVIRNERLVERYRTVGVRATWSPPTRRLLRARPTPAPAEVIDLSITGALLLAPRNDQVLPGSLVPFEHLGAHGLVEVRHVHDGPDPALCYYGVLFVDVQAELRRRIYELVGRQRGDAEELERSWRHAR